jgi:hypothetical protein
MRYVIEFKCFIESNFDRDKPSIARTKIDFFHGKQVYNRINDAESYLRFLSLDCVICGIYATKNETHCYPNENGLVKLKEDCRILFAYLDDDFEKPTSLISDRELKELLLASFLDKNTENVVWLYRICCLLDKVELFNDAYFG